MTLNLQRAASELAKKLAALRLPGTRTSARQKKRLSVCADRSRARAIVHALCAHSPHRSFPSEREFMTRVPRWPRHKYWASCSSTVLLAKCHSQLSSLVRHPTRRDLDVHNFDAQTAREYLLAEAGRATPELVLSRGCLPSCPASRAVSCMDGCNG